MPVSFTTSRDLQVAAGEVPAVVRVKNLQGTIQGPSDAWGRPNRPQPISVSVTVGMDKAFVSTSVSDALASDTVHYGLLSKAVLATLARLDAEESSDGVLSLPDVLENIWIDLTGLDTFGFAVEDKATSFLKLESIRTLEVTVLLPKASLVGGGASVTGIGLFVPADRIGGIQASTPRAMLMRGMSLKLHDLRIPILIGVNSNERAAKQAVIANIEVERFDELLDGYPRLESEIVNVMSESSYETLEALVADLAVSIATHLAFKHKPPADGDGWNLKISVEKPIAVVFADAPCVELRVNTNDVAMNSRAQK